jgi:hypothetical protein
MISRQVRERIKQHALIVSTSFGREFSFDHEDFREFFLGEQLASHLISESEHDIRRLFRVDNLPDLAIETAIHRVFERGKDSAPLIDLMLKVGASEGPSSFVRENAGALIAPLLSCSHTSTIHIEGLVFPPESLNARCISDVQFASCYFRPTALIGGTLSNCIFKDCEMEFLSLSEHDQISNSSFINTRIHSISVTKSNVVDDYYAPDEIFAQVVKLGFSVESQSVNIETAATEGTDDDLRIVEKALQTFQRMTYVPEGTFRLRLSINATHFINELLPLLIKVGVIEQVQVGANPKYRRCLSFSKISRALALANGSFDRFLGAAKTMSL